VLSNTYLLNGFSVKHLPAMYIRRRKKVHSYACKTENQAIKDKEKHHFSFEGYDLTQKVYLIPLYFSALSNV
jgi:hypothetical protein